MKLNNILSTIEQLKVRVNFLEHWNFSLIYDQLQKIQIQMLINDNDVSSSKHRPVDRRSTRVRKLTNVRDCLLKLFFQGFYLNRN
jgi:hypothetical protein